MQAPEGDLEYFKESTSSSGPQKCALWHHVSFSLPATASSLDISSVLLLTLLSKSHLPILIPFNFHFNKSELSEINTHLILLKIIQLFTFLRIKTQIFKVTYKNLSYCLKFQS